MKTWEEYQVEELLGLNPFDRVVMASVECFHQSREYSDPPDFAHIAKVFLLDGQKLESHFYWFFHHSNKHEPYVPIARHYFAREYRQLKREKRRPGLR